MVMFSPIALEALVAQIPDGAALALPADYSGVPMAATHALIRRGVRGLRLVTIPQSTLQADLLIGAGCVASIETAAVTMGEFGIAPCFTRAVLSGAIKVIDSTCPVIHAGLQAAEKDVPFLPLRGVLGSDLVKHRPDWRVVDNPMGPPMNGGGDPILLVPAIRPDVTLFHAPMADREGNVWIGRRRELATLAHASKLNLVTVERIHDGSFFDDEILAAGTLPALYVEAVAIAERGAAPVGLFGQYEPDAAHLKAYSREARTEAGFAAYLAREVMSAKEAA
jgi:glutaconate CoA-transferase subunit A